MPTKNEPKPVKLSLLAPHAQAYEVTPGKTYVVVMRGLISNDDARAVGERFKDLNVNGIVLCPHEGAEVTLFECDVGEVPAKPICFDCRAPIVHAMDKWTSPTGNDYHHACAERCMVVEMPAPLTTKYGIREVGGVALREYSVTDEHDRLSAKATEQMLVAQKRAIDDSNHVAFERMKGAYGREPLIGHHGGALVVKQLAPFTRIPMSLDDMSHLPHAEALARTLTVILKRAGEDFTILARRCVDWHAFAFDMHGVSGEYEDVLGSPLTPCDLRASPDALVDYALTRLKEALRLVSWPAERLAKLTIQP